MKVVIFSLLNFFVLSLPILYLSLILVVMVKLVVSWWGDYTDSKKLDHLYKEMLKGKKILYIPRAMYPERYDSCYEWIQNVFPAQEWYSVYLLSEKEFWEKESDYAMYDGIYMGGGNTYRLLKLIKDTWFSKIIEQFLAHDKPIYGGSAGAAIMGKEIHTSGDMNGVKLPLEEAMGFNMWNNHALVCHYHDSSDSEIKDYVSHYNIPVICLPEGTWLIYANDHGSVQGDNPAYLFMLSWEKKELPIGTEI